MNATFNINKSSILICVCFLPLNPDSVKRILCFKLGKLHVFKSPYSLKLTKQDDNNVSARRFPHLMTNMQSDIKMA